MRSPLRMAACALGAALLVALTASPARAAKSYSAERFDARIRVLPAGDLEVTETVAFRFESGTFDHVFRELSTRRTDGIEIVSASMDGRPFPAGEGVDRIEVSGRSKRRVEWRFAPVSDSTHVFVLTYIARGVVTQTDDADVLAWRALPSEHQYRIAASAIEFILPGAAAAGGDAATTPSTEAHRVDGTVTGSLERGTEDVAAPPLHARIVAERIRSNGWVEPTFRLARGSLISAPPAWQQSALAAAAVAPRWLAAAAVIVFAGLVLLFGLRQQYDRPSVDTSALSSGGSVPDALAPALAGALVSNGRTSLEHAQAAIFALADRGVLAIEEQRGRFGVQNFDITRKRSSEPLAGHERVLLTTMFDQESEDRTSLTSARRRLVRRFRQFSAAVNQDLLSAGLIDADRQRIRARFVALGIILFVTSGLAVPAAAFFVSRFGAWPMLIPAALAVVAISSFIAAGSVTPLSNDGVRRAARWRGFRGYLKTVSQDRAPSPIANLGALLPFAVATGLAPYWARYIKKHPGSVPAWFRGLSTASQDRAFTAFVTASHAHGGGAAGGGAAGGGGSGAG